MLVEDLKGPLEALRYGPGDLGTHSTRKGALTLWWLMDAQYPHQ